MLSICEELMGGCDESNGWFEIKNKDNLPCIRKGSFEIGTCHGLGLHSYVKPHNAFNIKEGNLLIDCYQYGAEKIAKEQVRVKLMDEFCK